MKRSLLVLAFTCVMAVAAAQTRPRAASAADSYHTGARLFIDGENEQAASVVDAALTREPANARLQALRDLIKQQQQDQSDRQQQEQDGDPQDQNDGNDGDGGQNSPEDRGQNQPPAPERDEAARDGTDNRQEQNGGQSPSDSEPAGGENQDNTAPAPGPRGQMSRAQAERILDAVAGDERLLIEEMRRAPSRVRRNVKDW